MINLNIYESDISDQNFNLSKKLKFLITFFCFLIISIALFLTWLIPELRKNYIPVEVIESDENLDSITAELIIVKNQKYVENNILTGPRYLDPPLEMDVPILKFNFLFKENINTFFCKEITIYYIDALSEEELTVWTQSDLFERTVTSGPVSYTWDDNFRNTSISIRLPEKNYVLFAAVSNAKIIQLYIFQISNFEVPEHNPEWHPIE